MYKRHIFFYKFFYPLVVLFLRIRFGYRFQLAENLPDTYIVLSNHTTDYDPVLVAASFKRYMYFVASEHITRWKLVYKFLSFCFAPIIRYKGTTATTTVAEMLKMVRKGKNVCMFAEGARCWDGVTAPILPSTGKVIKSARCGLVTYRLEGGYFVSPNWSGSNLRRGRLYGAPVNVYTAEQLKEMSVEEINEAIARDLYEDAYARQMAKPVRYKGKKLAERMENLLFICPECDSMDSLHSQNDTVSCRHCDYSFRYNEYCMLEGGRFQTIRDFAAWQEKEVDKAAAEGAIYTASTGTLSTVAGSQEVLVSSGRISLSSEALCCGEHRIPLVEIADMAMHGKRAIVFSTKEAYYELIPSEEVASLKFHLLYKAYKKQLQKKKTG